ncbi:MAG: hypothetical protein GOVbin2429_51 [Prokaryotic dsDNA virus sp.]|nr:MAG: hypothetical protein Tp162SUR1511541_27 [Prokaryotic dsDNA virus sp.]QDP63867.1 MAG: hypothetical protein GOVbin2429_51 [Prokaryotic dsDNA virus sp.]
MTHTKKPRYGALFLYIPIVSIVTDSKAGAITNTVNENIKPAFRHSSFSNIFL